MPIDNALLVLNGKGGVLKTSLTAQLAGLAAVSGWRTLAVDLDPQGNLARDLGFADRSDAGNELHAAVVSGRAPEPIRDVRPGLDVLAAGAEGTGKLMHHIAASAQGMSIPNFDQLDVALGKIAPDYNLVVLDSPPGGDSIHAAAMAAARAVLIPTQPDLGSIDGLAIVAQALVSARRTVNPTIEILGVVLGPVATNATRLLDHTFTRLEELLGNHVHVFKQTIRSAQAVAVACRDSGLLVHEYEQEARSSVQWRQRVKMTAEQRRREKTFSTAAPGLASDYVQLADEVLARFAALRAEA